MLHFESINFITGEILRRGRVKFIITAAPVAPTPKGVAPGRRLPVRRLRPVLLLPGCNTPPPIYRYIIAANYRGSWPFDSINTNECVSSHVLRRVSKFVPREFTGSLTGPSSGEKRRRKKKGEEPGGSVRGRQERAIRTIWLGCDVG